MNRFEKKFFERYVPQGQEIKGIIHQHWVWIIGTLFFWLIAGAIIPSFLYIYSLRIQELIPLFYLQGFLIVIYIKVVYEVFNWYNDVWIITDKWVVDLDWELWSTDMKTVNYENIEWQEVGQNGIWDTILRKWDIILHKIWDDQFSLEDAVNPYGAVDMIEHFSSQIESYDEPDKFDMLLENLWWVMDDYLERKWLKWEHNNLKEQQDIQVDENTIDLR